MVANAPGGTRPIPFLWPPLEFPTVLGSTNGNILDDAQEPKLVEALDFQALVEFTTPSDLSDLENGLTDDEDANDEYILQLRSRIYERYLACARLQAQLLRLRSKVHSEDITLAHKHKKHLEKPTCRQSTSGASA